METYQEMTAGPAIFQIGIPVWDGHPTKLFERIRSHSLKAETTAPALYPDPRGELELRREIAAYLAVARGIHCCPEQIIITAGFSGGLGVALRALRLEGRKAWIEDPGFLFTRKGLELSGLDVVPVPVDEEGISVEQGLALSPDAAVAVVTPGQQAPLGVTLSLNRRMQLLNWARSNNAWVIEDDYLSELQLAGRAAPALGSLDGANRVIHIGTFSKTVSPAMRLGFVVAPTQVASAFANVAATLAPAPWPALQLAVAYFMREGHYLRHLRRIKRLYAAQRDALATELDDRGARWTSAGLAILLRLPEGSQDVRIAREAIAFGLAPSPLSTWYADNRIAQQGLLLGVATAPERHLAKSCRRLFELIRRCSTNE
ncbi:PLP-dependent aminotransferase family protein [Stenotrophomonas maltophilia]|uniref:aminotransferase-like domain-containing protein n=1 Tax=Stenotrophomonas maltophilia TaxID=40324 RepID=UPI00289E3CF3|nr:PLP-dependent aminotransferase family protein [Stenotrophomonas maltophilia]